MVTITYCLRRKPGMSREDFQTYWKETHAPLVARHADTLGITRYVQKHALPDGTAEDLRASRGAPTGFDGVAEISFASLDALAAAAANPGFADAARALLEDEATFIDMANSPIGICEDHVVIGDEAD